MKYHVLRIYLAALIFNIPLDLQVNGVLLQCSEIKQDEMFFIMDHETRKNVIISGPFWLKWIFYKNESSNRINWYFQDDQTKHLICRSEDRDGEEYNTSMKSCSECYIEYKSNLNITFFHRFTILVEEIGGENDSKHFSSSHMEIFYKGTWDIQQDNCTNITCSSINATTSIIMWMFYFNCSLKEEFFSMRKCQFPGGSNNTYIENFACVSSHSVTLTLRETVFLEGGKLYVRCFNPFIPYVGSESLLVRKGNNTSCGDVHHDVEEICGGTHEDTHPSKQQKGRSMSCRDAHRDVKGICRGTDEDNCPDKQPTGTNKGEFFLWKIMMRALSVGLFSLLVL